jgi:hypothetical protein
MITIVVVIVGSTITTVVSKIIGVSKARFVPQQAVFLGYYGLHQDYTFQGNMSGGCGCFQVLATQQNHSNDGDKSHRSDPSPAAPHE